MDHKARTIDVIKAVNAFTGGRMEDHVLLSSICEYFDHMKGRVLSTAEKKILLYLSAQIGVPHYYDMLVKFNSEFSPAIDDEAVDLQTFSSLLYESTLYTDENSKLHKYQQEILNLFDINKKNRYFLSASTSFGKTHLVYEIIRKMKYDNIVLIFPTIALLSENLDRIRKRGIDKVNNYRIQTLSDTQIVESPKNIFIFTPERFLSFIDKEKNSFKIDFLFVDEIYKIDKGLLIDEEAKENERDVSYRLALYQGLDKFPKADVLLVGPYIQIYKKKSQKYNPSFDNFLEENEITKVNRNQYEIVKVRKADVENERSSYKFDDLDFDFTSRKTKREKVQEVCDKILQHGENVIVYSNTKSNAEKIADEYNLPDKSVSKFNNFYQHLLAHYNNDWVLIDCIKKGVGIHHGLVPKYIQKEIIELFNSGELKVLTATTTITEGVNTTAKNILVYKSLKGHTKEHELVSFDAKNIAGRAGRFMEHYTGRVITLDGNFIKKLEEEGEMIRHKNYDANSSKSEIDDEMTPQKFQDETAKERIRKLKEMQDSRGIPDSIINQYKVVKKRDKIKIYDAIVALSSSEKVSLDKFVTGIQSHGIFIDKDGFQIFLKVIFDIVEYEKLKFLIERKYTDKKGNEYSVLFVALFKYIQSGFAGAFEYHYGAKTKKGDKNAVNNAMRYAADLIYNTFKYQLVKYLGVFNLMYRFIESQRLQKDFDKIKGIERLITKLEYNSFTEEGRIANDYGVPYKIVEYYDAGSRIAKEKILKEFDAYEAGIFKKVKKIIDPEK